MAAGTGPVKALTRELRQAEDGVSKKDTHCTLHGVVFEILYPDLAAQHLSSVIARSERDEAIHLSYLHRRRDGLLRFARNDAECLE